VFFGGHDYFFLAVLADWWKAASVGAPLLPGFRIRSTGLTLGLFTLDAFLLGVYVGVQTRFRGHYSFSKTQATSPSWISCKSWPSMWKTGQSRYVPLPYLMKSPTFTSWTLGPMATTVPSLNFFGVLNVDDFRQLPDVRTHR